MTTATKFHINPETGRPGTCSASVRDCIYTVDGIPAPHYDTLDEAFDAYEKMNDEKTVMSLKKKTEVDSFSAQNDIFVAGKTVADSESTGRHYLIDEEVVENSKNETVEAQKPTKLSAPTKPSEYQAAAPVSTIEPETALTLVDDLPDEKNQALVKKSSEWTERITALNPHSQEFGKQIQAINKIAGKAFTNTATLSKNFLNDTASRKGQSASDTVGNNLVKLRNVMEDMAPEEDTFKSKALSFLPGRNAVKKYFNRFESNAKQMDVIVASLDKGQAMLHQENTELAIEREQLWNDLGTLQEADGLLKNMDAQVVEKIAEEKAKGNAEMVKALEQNVLFNIRQRRQDVVTQTAVTIQSFMAMGMIEENNNKLMQNVERTKTTTATALATAARISQALGNQKNILKGVETMRNTTNKLMTENAKQLQQNTVQIQQQATSASVDTNVIKESFDSMFATMDQMDSFRDEANQNFLVTIDALSEQVNRASEYAKARNVRNGIGASSKRLEIEDDLAF